MEIIEKLKRTYNQLGYDNLELLEEIYTDNVLFIDPFHRVEGRPALIRHFKNLYQNLLSIHFDYTDEMTSENNSFLTWRMDFSHRAIKKGNPISVVGVTLLKFNDKIYHHQDYFDATAMVFEHLPLIGSMIRLIRKRV